jgi:hypothetical protein
MLTPSPLELLPGKQLETSGLAAAFPGRKVTRGRASCQRSSGDPRRVGTGKSPPSEQRQAAQKATGASRAGLEQATRGRGLCRTRGVTDRDGSGIHAATRARHTAVAAALGSIAELGSGARLQRSEAAEIGAALLEGGAVAAKLAGSAGRGSEAARSGTGCSARTQLLRDKGAAVGAAPQELRAVATTLASGTQGNGATSRGAARGGAGAELHGSEARSIEVARL